jgi:hypothetical protein
MSRRESRWFAQVFPGVLRLFPSCPGQPLPTPHDELVILVKENIKLLPGCLDEIVPPPLRRLAKPKLVLFVSFRRRTVTLGSDPACMM